MTPYSPSAFFEGFGHNGNVQFVDEAHAEFYDLGMQALAGMPVRPATVHALRDRMVPFMDLSDAHIGCDFIADMGGRERAELRKRGFIAVRRFLAWAMEYAQEASEATVNAYEEAGSVYDPDSLLEVLVHQARGRPGTRRAVWLASEHLEGSP